MNMGEQYDVDVLLAAEHKAMKENDWLKGYYSCWDFEGEDERNIPGMCIIQGDGKIIWNWDMRAGYVTACHELYTGEYHPHVMGKSGIRKAFRIELDSNDFLLMIRSIGMDV